jgi:malonate-semialdehyde dehydrogenase (acetylating)/methylmalonate-semialdehyde dehydrogenase
MSLTRLKNYVNGTWVEAETEAYLPVENPSTGEVLAQVPLSTAAEVDRAVASAAEAFPAWSQTPAPRRVEPLFRLLERLKSEEEFLARSIAAENGKSLTDARAEMKRTVQNLEVACGMPILQMGDKLVNSAAGIDGEVLRLPVGVFAMIAPFNFPAMVPFWFIPYALATGNTYVVKPSEQTPLTMQRIAEYLDDCGLPRGVFNLVHGDKTAATALLDNPQVSGISFVGSSRVAREVARKCGAAGKRFQALGGAKNHLVVMPDARLDQVVRNMVTSCYGCAGQRCMASSVIVCVGEAVYTTIIERYVAASRDVIVANPLDPEVAEEPMVIGPVISAAAKQRIESLIEEGIREGARLVLDGRGVTVKRCERGYFIGPTVFTDVKPGMTIHTEEIFGPVVCIMKVDTLDEAIKIINDHPYGNGASIYTQNGYYARKFKLETQAGMIGVNVGIPAPVAYLPFGGMKNSLFADIKAQGKAVINFFTAEKIITERYWPET